MNERKKPMKTTLLVIAATLTVATSVLGVIGDTREKLIAGAGDIVVKELNVSGGYHILQTVFDDRVEIAILIEGKSEAEFIEFPNKETFERSTQNVPSFSGSALRWTARRVTSCLCFRPMGANQGS